ncbi:MAG: F0F1 ATP synthase subunit A [Myxococcales bacterium]
MFPALGENMKNLGPTLFGKEAGPQTAEPLVGMVFIIVLIAGLAFATRAKITNYDEAVKPDAHLSLRTFFEILIGYFYDMMKDMMGPARAKRYFPIVGTAAVFILVANFLGMVPGFPLITSTWSVTAGCAAVVFIAFNYYGIKENGAGYFKHLAGPVWWLAPLIFPLEVFSLCLRPMTLSVRLMLNMSVDHLLLAIALGALALVLPIPVMVLGTLVAIVQVLVFCLLSSIYIALATEHEEHGEGHGHAHGKKHHDEAHAH